MVGPLAASGGEKSSKNVCSNPKLPASCSPNPVLYANVAEATVTNLGELRGRKRHRHFQEADIPGVPSVLANVVKSRTLTAMPAATDLKSKAFAALVAFGRSEKPQPQDQCFLIWIAPEVDSKLP